MRSLRELSGEVASGVLTACGACGCPRAGVEAAPGVRGCAGPGRGVSNLLHPKWGETLRTTKVLSDQQKMLCAQNKRKGKMKTRKKGKMKTRKKKRKEVDLQELRRE